MEEDSPGYDGADDSADEFGHHVLPTPTQPASDSPLRVPVDAHGNHSDLAAHIPHIGSGATVRSRFVIPKREQSASSSSMARPAAAEDDPEYVRVKKESEDDFARHMRRKVRELSSEGVLEISDSQ